MSTAYLRNVWYVAAWEEELQGGALLARTLLDVPRVLYRCADGRIALLHDRCPHRFAPLSMGLRQRDSVTCRYHGLSFGPEGRCTHNPQGGPATDLAVVESLPAVARHGLVWFWPGDPAAADTALIPDFSFLVGQELRRRHSRFDGNYELVSDNLMDLSHVDHLHRATFNTNGTHVESVQEVFDGADDTLWTTWLVPKVRRFPVIEPLFPTDVEVDQFLEMRWSAPASMMLRISWVAHGSPPSSAPLRLSTPHLITPETQGNSHYFWSCEPDDASEAFARSVFDGEDKPMIEAVQRRMAGEDFWSLSPVVLPGDKAAIRVRRRMQKLRAQES